MFSKLCSSCDYSGSEKKVATGVTLQKCMSMCAAMKACTAIDFGKGNRAGECFVNTGAVKKHSPNGGFDAYVKKTKSGKSNEILVFTVARSSARCDYVVTLWFITKSPTAVVLPC